MRSRKWADRSIAVASAGMAEHTALEVSEWMAERVTADGYLDQSVAVAEIESLFGEQFVYDKDGSQRIDKGVLKKFEALTKETVVWERRDLRWCLNEPGDAPGRMQR